MASGKFVTYFRVSTARQGQSGLGLEAQRKAVSDYLNGGNWQVVGEFVEVESGKRDDRAELCKAIDTCRVYGARLLIAKLDRLSRNAAFLIGLRDAGVQFVAADMPDANEMTIGIMAVVAQGERKMISDRTRAALAAAKARGTVLGGFRGHRIGKVEQEAGAVVWKGMADAKANDVAPIIEQIRAGQEMSLRAIAAQLTARGVPTSRGKTEWTAAAVSRVLSRAG
jgi:DNA invertase Pin-like site-specific DNA recombinase